MRLVFKHIFLLQSVILVTFVCLRETSAQVGGRPACTNFTCRYGECEQLETKFVCHCPDGIKGVNCDLKIQPGDSICSSSPCWGDGSCVDLGNDYKCICPAGRTGKNCRTIESAPCLFQNPCRNNAICRVTNNNDFFCYCVGFWTGRYCDIALGLCSLPTPCFNGGVCENNICNCPSNFTGYQCESYNPPIRYKIVKVLNKGFYVADLKLYYEIQQNNLEKNPVWLNARIPINKEHVFYVPDTVNLAGQTGVTLYVDAVLGKRVLETRVLNNPECIHVWGTTLIPFWTRINC